MSDIPYNIHQVQIEDQKIDPCRYINQALSAMLVTVYVM